MSMLFPHLGPSTPTFRRTCCARRHRSSSSTSVRERLASANALAISGKRCEPGFPDAEPFYTYTAPPRIFFGLTILMSGNLHAVHPRLGNCMCMQSCDSGFPVACHFRARACLPKCESVEWVECRSTVQRWRHLAKKNHRGSGGAGCHWGCIVYQVNRGLQRRND
jgi:hypothetical protein